MSRTENNVKKRLVRPLLFLVLPLSVPVIFLLHMVFQYGVNVPYADEWSMVPIYQKIDQGSSVISVIDSLWQPFNIHRLFFPRIVVTISAYLTHMNIKAEMLLGVGFCVLTAILLYLIIQRTIKRPLLTFLTMLLVSFWLFSPIQYENWLWGWDVSWFMCVAAVVATIFLISRMRNEKQYLNLTGAIAAAMIATFSLGGGLVLWPVGLAMLVAQKQKKKPIIIWVVSALAAIGLYYYHYNPSSYISSAYSSQFLHEPLANIRFYLAMFGGLSTSDLSTEILLGAIGLLLLIPVVWIAWEQRKKIDIFLSWLGLMVFTLLGNVVITVSRFSELNASTPNATTPSRYTTFTVLYYIGLLGFIFTALDKLRYKSLVKYAVLVIVLVSTPLIYSSYSVGITSLKPTYEARLQWKYCSSEPIVSDNCLASTGYIFNEATYQTYRQNTKQIGYIIETNNFRGMLQFLKDKHWAGY